jgi:hypothetical protein
LKRKKCSKENDFQALSVINVEPVEIVIEDLNARRLEPPRLVLCDGHQNLWIRFAVEIAFLSPPFKLVSGHG